MVDLKQSPRRFGRKASLIAAGLLAATSSLVLLPKSSVPAANATAANPVVAKVLSDARKHRSKGRYAKAAALLKDHATPGNPLVLLNYGKLLARGWGVPKNLDEAREKLLMAVQHDFPKRGEAAFELGRVYRQSVGPDCDRIAFEWFVESAKAGHVKAHAELGRHYARGIGVPVDIHNALKHYRIAARSGAANWTIGVDQKYLGRRSLDNLQRREQIGQLCLILCKSCLNRAGTNLGLADTTAQCAKRILEGADGLRKSSNPIVRLSRFTQCDCGGLQIISRGFCFDHWIGGQRRANQAKTKAERA